MTRAKTAALITSVLLLSFAWRVFGQAPPGFSGVYDASNGALKVNTVAGTATGGTFGTAFPTTGSPIGGRDANGGFASVTMTNNALNVTGAVYPDGTNWAMTGTSANVAMADSTTASTPMGALASVTTANLAGNVGAVFQVQSGGTLVGTLTPECSFDGGTTYPLAVQLNDPSTGQDAPTKDIVSGQATTPLTVVCPFGASHARMRVSSYTSGTVNMVARATVGGFPNSVPTILNAGTVSAANTATSVTLNAVTGQRVCINSIILFGNAVNGAASVTVTDGTTVVQMGMASLTVSNAAVFFDGSPICGRTGSNMTVNIGAGGTNVITTTSVVGDRA